MDVNTTEAIRMTKDGDASIILDVPDQLVRATRYDEIYIFIEVKEGRYDISSSDELDRGVRD